MTPQQQPMDQKPGPPKVPPINPQTPQSPIRAQAQVQSVADHGIPYQTAVSLPAQKPVPIASNTLRSLVSTKPSPNLNDNSVRANLNLSRVLRCGRCSWGLCLRFLHSVLYICSSRRRRYSGASHFSSPRLRFFIFSNSGLQHVTIPPRHRFPPSSSAAMAPHITLRIAPP